jgi:hypothetical protein
LHHVEGEFNEHVTLRRLLVRDAVAELRLEFWVHERDGPIHRDGMAGVVRRVVAERSEREGILVDIACVPDEGLDEVPGADVVQEVAEEVTAEGVVAEVLDDAPAVGVRARFEQLFRRRLGKRASNSALIVGSHTASMLASCASTE